MKRFLYLLIIVVVVVAVVLLGYFLRYRASEPGSEATGGGSLPPVEQGGPVAPGGGTAPGGQTPGQGTGGAAQQPQVQPGEQKFGVIAQNPVADYFVDNDNNVVLVQPDGKIIRVSRGEVSTLSSSEISNISNVEFSGDGKKILVAFGGIQAAERSVFDVESKAWSPLEAGIKSSTWSPSGYQIAYIKEGNGVNAITTLDLSKKGAKPVEFTKLNVEDARLLWLSPEKMIVADKGSALSAGSLWTLNTKTKALSRVAGETIGLDSCCGLPGGGRSSARFAVSQVTGWLPGFLRS